VTCIKFETDKLIICTPNLDFRFLMLLRLKTTAPKRPNSGQVSYFLTLWQNIRAKRKVNRIAYSKFQISDILLLFDIRARYNLLATWWVEKRGQFLCFLSNVIFSVKFIGGVGEMCVSIRLRPIKVPTRWLSNIDIYDTCNTSSPYDQTSHILLAGHLSAVWNIRAWVSKI